MTIEEIYEDPKLQHTDRVPPSPWRASHLVTTRFGTFQAELDGTAFTFSHGKLKRMAAGTLCLLVFFPASSWEDAKKYIRLPKDLECTELHSQFAAIEANTFSAKEQQTLIKYEYAKHNRQTGKSRSVGNK